MNPLDYIYQAVGCNIRTLEEKATETQYLLKYIHSSACEFYYGYYNSYFQWEQ